jgi:hypothetical protein
VSDQVDPQYVRFARRAEFVQRDVERQRYVATARHDGRAGAPRRVRRAGHAPVFCDRAAPPPRGGDLGFRMSCAEWVVSEPIYALPLLVSGFDHPFL